MSSAIPVFLISGWSESGKDTVGKILCDHYGFKRLAFADILKQIVAVEYHIPLSLMYSTEGKNLLLSDGNTIRQTMIRRGQEIRAADGDGIFAEAIAEKIIAGDHLSVRGYCITDWRLPVEYSVLEKACFSIRLPLFKIRVRKLSQQVSPVADQLTEHALDRWVFDAYLDNNGLDMWQIKQEIGEKLTPFMLRE